MQSYLYKNPIYFFAYNSGVIQLCKGFWGFGREQKSKFFEIFFQQGKYYGTHNTIYICMVISVHFTAFYFVLFI